MEEEFSRPIVKILHIPVFPLSNNQSVAPNPMFSMHSQG